MKISREKICDLLDEKNISISERNVSHIINLYNRLLSIDNNEINLAIQNELLNFSCIKISFDTISIPENDITVVIVRDSRGNVIGLYEFYNINKRELYEKINIYFTYKNIHSIYFDESCEVLKQTIKYLSDENTLLIPYKIG